MKTGSPLPEAFPAGKFRLGAALLLCVLALGAPVSEGRTLEDGACLLCHRETGGRAAPAGAQALADSAHARIQCISCHLQAGTVPHPESQAPVACGRCHGAQSEMYLNTRHGCATRRGRTEAETCSDCHGAGHGIRGSDRKDSPVSRQQVSRTCAGCHQDTERAEGVELLEAGPVASYLRSVHGPGPARAEAPAADCADCHGAHSLYDSTHPESPVSRRNISGTCGKCHPDVSASYAESAHGRAALRGDRQTPFCTDCHGGHAVASRTEADAPARVEAETCSGCHESEPVIRNFGLPRALLGPYGESYHGLAARRGDAQAVGCTSCHGHHGILPPEDPRSSVHGANLPMTCGTCHPGAGRRLAEGTVHGLAQSKHWSIRAALWFYWIVIPLALGAMLLHNGLDWARKTLTGVRRAVHTDVVRFTVNERVQHFFLLASFIVLALSGFALEFPDAAWVRWLAIDDEAVRRSVHRGAALVFSLLSAYHLAYMVFSDRGRRLLREMVPRRSDGKDLLEVVAYNLGVRKEPPVHSGFYRYPEKIEYWSLVWGTGVMILTGALLISSGVTLRHFPLWVFDLATMVHYYEAILACAAVAVWHFYGVIFDPDVYPMNCAWFHGRIRRPRAVKPAREEYSGETP